MRTRFLGVLLIALVVIGGLNIVQAIRFNFFDGPGLSKLPDISSLDHVDVDVRVHGHSAADEVMIDRTFDVSSGGWLDIDVQHSDITIRTSDTDEAHIRVTIDSRNMNRAQEVFERLDYRVEQDGDRIFIRSEQPRNMNWRTRMSIEVEVTIPVNFNLELESTHGDVALDDLNGNVSVTTTHGDVKAGTMKGDRVMFSTTHGDLEADELSASVVTLETTHGDIEADRIDAEEFNASTTHSDISLDELTGRSRIVTTHGDVRIGMASENDLSISTSHGDVDLYVSDSMGATLDLRGQEIRIPSSADFKGVLKEKMAEGTINGGGAHLEISTSFGDVTLHQR